MKLTKKQMAEINTDLIKANVKLTTDKQSMIEEVNTIKAVYEKYKACNDKIAVEHGKMKKDLHNARTVARVAEMNIDRLLVNRSLYIKINERLRDKLTDMTLCRNCWRDKAKKLQADVSSMRKEYFAMADSVQELDTIADHLDVSACKLADIASKANDLKA